MKKRIVLADDDDLILYSFSLTIAVHGYDVITASNGREALDAICQKELTPNQVSLLITDLNMPVMDGLALIAEVRKIERKVPILVVSGHYDHKIRQELAQRGVEGILEKPVDPKSFLSEIFRILPI